MTGERTTKKQQQLLEFVDQFIRDHDYSPSYREIMTALGYKSVSTVSVHVEALIAKGFLHRQEGSIRSLEVVKSRSLADEKSTTASSAEQTIIDTLTTILADKSTTTDDLQALVRALTLLGYTTATAIVKEKLAQEAPHETS